jgi:hypothetical protein
MRFVILWQLPGKTVLHLLPHYRAGLLSFKLKRVVNTH